MRIYLIRHGQTDWNVEGKVQGSTDIPLNETGRRQAACLAKGMAGRPVVQIFSSRLKRAFETARTVGESQNVRVETVEGLEEISFGEWEGLTWKDIKKRYPREYKLWWENPTGIAPTGGETREALERRAGQAARRMLARAKGDFAVVVHGGIMAYLAGYLLRANQDTQDGTGKKESRSIIVENASITTLDYDAVSRTAVLVEENDVSHLRDL